MTSVVVADDQALIRAGLRMMLEHRGVEVLGEAADGAQAVELVVATRPDVVLMDIRMPVQDGIAATAELTRRHCPSRVLVLTTYDVDAYVYAALKAGASGFLLKSVEPDRLVHGLEVVAAGEELLGPTVTRRLVEQYLERPPPADGPHPRLRALTAREMEVLRLVARGLSNDDIREELTLTEATVKTHVNRILAKLGLSSRVQAVVLAYETGLVRPGDQGPA